ncbi:MAG: ABC transporter permease [Microbacterium sp.]|nr:ABC transporter permease [Microbacterium sp.]MBA4346054.1 ABC transporter permease [Microbacterium sp.]
MITRKISRVALYAFLFFLVVLLVGPFLWLTLASFKDGSQILTAGSPILPVDENGNVSFRLDNYVFAFDYLQLNTLFVNTFLVATIATAFNLFFNSLAGYAFARMNFRGREVLFRLILASLMVPGTVMLVPNMIIINQLGLFDSLAALIVPFVMSVYNIFLMRQTFLGFPRELEEAAIIDGAGTFRVFWMIAMPLARPMLVVLGITTFMWNYNSFLWPLVIIQSPENGTLALGLGSLVSASATNAELYPVMLAASVVISVPLILIFLVFQKFIVKGIASGALKG